MTEVQFICPKADRCERKKKKFTMCFHDKPHSAHLACKEMSHCATPCVPIGYTLVTNETEKK
jgi:hypothetical protein